MFKAIEGQKWIADLPAAIPADSTLTYWDGDGGLTDPCIAVTDAGGNTDWIGLPGLLCEVVPDPTPEPMERIAAALERIADKLDALTSGAGNLKVERP